MFKVYLLIALTIVGTYAQELTQVEVESKPEPYSYGYQTDSHSASEQKDPNGKVSGFYMLADADGRQRRVEYYADETGFHAKVQTNEVGTKSENSANVEILASPPGPEQYVAQQQSQAQQVTRYSSQQGIPYSYGNNQAYSYGAASKQYGAVNQYSATNKQYAVPNQQYGVVNQQYSVANKQYGIPSQQYAVSNQQYSVANKQYGVPSQQLGVAYNPGYSYGASTGQYGYGTGAVTSYNNHLPSSYYKSVTQSSSVQPIGYSSGGVVSRYSQSSVGPATYHTVQGVGVPTASGVQTSSSRYQSSSVVPISSGYSNAGQGSSNYIVLKKREQASADK